MYSCNAFWNTVFVAKCSAANCRSGPKPTKSEQQILQQGNREPAKRSVFTFHKKDRQEIREQWIKVLKLRHRNWNPENFEVYELHFHDTDFFDHSATWRNKARQNSTKFTLKNFTDLLNRGNFIYPSRIAIDISKNINVVTTDASRGTRGRDMFYLVVLTQR